MGWGNGVESDGRMVMVVFGGLQVHEGVFGEGRVKEMVGLTGQ